MYNCKNFFKAMSIHDIFMTFSRLFQDIFTTSDEKSRENDGTYIRFHDIFTTFSRLVPVVFHDRFTTVSRHFHDIFIMLFSRRRKK